MRHLNGSLMRILPKRVSLECARKSLLLTSALLLLPTSGTNVALWPSGTQAMDVTDEEIGSVASSQAEPLG